MALIVEQRPEEQLFVEENPTIYDTPYYTSRFNAANLPLVYKISNTKFPVNTEDVIEDILSVSNNAGFAQLTLDAATYTFLAKGTVEITNTTSYNGVWSIRSVIDSNNIVINAPFVADEIGNVQNYYNNYSTLVKVYSGLPEYHPLNSTKPMTLITDNPITVTPNSDNEATIDVSALVKSKLNLNNDYELNDIDLFNAFYIEYSEQYDESDGNTVSVTTEAFTADLIEGCDAGAADFITNGDFATDLTGWTNTGTGIAWVFDTGAAQTTLSISNRNSQTLFQDELGLTNGVEYDISFDYNTGGEDVKYTVGLGFDNIYQATLNGSGTISFKTIFSGNSTGSFSGIAFTTELLSTPATSIDVRLDNVTLLNQLTNPCLAYIFSSHSALQPQAKYGGNMGEYVQNFNGGVFANKWLTLMQEPVLFEGNYFDLSTLIPQAVIQSAIQAGGFFLQIIEFDQNGTVIGENEYAITQNLGDGIYRFRLDDKTFNTKTKRFTAQILRIPVNLFTSGDQGTFNATADPNGNPPSDWNLEKDARAIINYDTVNTFEGTGSLSFESRSIFNDDYALAFYDYGKVGTNNNPQTNANQFIKIAPSLIDVTTQDFSIEARIYLNLDTINTSNGEFPYVFSFVSVASGTACRLVYLNDTDFRFNWFSPTNRAIIKTPLFKSWMHVIISFEHGVAAKFFLNGVKSEQTTDVQIQDSTLRENQGWFRPIDGNGANHAGYVRGLRIYDKALTDAEASSLYNSNAKTIQPVPVSAQPNLIKELLCNQEQGMKAVDTSTTDIDNTVENYDDDFYAFGGGTWVDVTTIG